MSIENVKAQLMKQRIFKGKIAAEMKRLDQQGTIAAVEIRKDIEALDFAIRLLGEVEREKRK